MFMPVLILIASTGLLLSCLHLLCQKFLRRRLNQEFYQRVVNANRLEFLSVRRTIEDFGLPVEYSRLTMTLKCDFLALTYLLENAANINQNCTYEEHLLILYFKVVYVSLITRHCLRLRETPALLKLTTILQYFANVVGERVEAVRFEELTTADYLLNI